MLRFSSDQELQDYVDDLIAGAKEQQELEATLSLLSMIVTLAKLQADT